VQVENVLEQPKIVRVLLHVIRSRNWKLLATPVVEVVRVETLNMHQPK